MAKMSVFLFMSDEFLLIKKMPVLLYADKHGRTFIVYLTINAIKKHVCCAKKE